MIRSNLSFLSTKARERNREESCPKSRSKKALALPVPDPSHRGEASSAAAPLRAPGQVSDPLWALVSPSSYQERLALFLQFVPVPTTVGAAHPHAGPCSTSVPLPKRGKETCVRRPGRARGSELSGCAGCCRVSAYHTNPRTEKSHLSGNHSYPGHTSNPNTARGPAKDHPRIPSGTLPSR